MDEQVENTRVLFIQPAVNKTMAVGFSAFQLVDTALNKWHRRELARLSTAYSSSKSAFGKHGMSSSPMGVRCRRRGDGSSLQSAELHCDRFHGKGSRRGEGRTLYVLGHRTSLFPQPLAIAFSKVTMKLPQESADEIISHPPKCCPQYIHMSLLSGHKIMDTPQPKTFFSKTLILTTGARNHG